MDNDASGHIKSICQNGNQKFVHICKISMIIYVNQNWKHEENNRSNSSFNKVKLIAMKFKLCEL